MCAMLRLFATPWTVACQAPLSTGILQARILEWVAMPSSRGSSQPRDRTQLSCITNRFFTVWVTKEIPIACIMALNSWTLQYAFPKNRATFINYFTFISFINLYWYVCLINHPCSNFVSWHKNECPLHHVTPPEKDLVQDSDIAFSCHISLASYQPLSFMTLTFFNTSPVDGEWPPQRWPCLVPRNCEYVICYLTWQIGLWRCDYGSWDRKSVLHHLGGPSVIL